MRRLVVLAPLLLAGCAGLNLGWGAVQQAGPGSAAIAVTPNCQGQSQAGDLPCISATGAQNMDRVAFDVGRDLQGRATLHVEAQGIDPSRNQAIAAQALANAVQQLAPIVAALAPIAATAVGGPTAGAIVGGLTKPVPLKPPPAVTVDTGAIPTTP